MDSTDRGREHLRWQHIEASVLDVYYENEHRETPEDDIKAHADTWGIHSSKRDELFRRTREKWIERTGKRIFDFPYSEDYVSMLYFKFRKRNQGELENHYRELNEGSI